LRISQINKFVERFNSHISLDEEIVAKKQGRYFLLDGNLKGLVSRDFFCAGTYLGKGTKNKFFPSFNLLRMISEGKANKTVVDKKTEWLFVCGRDIFKHGIVTVEGGRRKGAYTLILNQHRECLGFGKIVCDIDRESDGRAVAVENILDVGDFLRREKLESIRFRRKRKKRCS